MRWRSSSGGCARLAGLVLALAGAGAVAQSSGQSLGGPTKTEVDVTALDGGTYVLEGTRARPDGGVAQDSVVVPPELLRPSPAPYPEGALAERVGGVVELELLIDETGAVAEVTISRGAHPALDEAAVAAAKGLGFHPASLGGEHIPVRIRYSYEFVAPPPPPQLARISGEIRARGTRRPIPGAVVLEEGKVVAEADAEGRFAAELPPGEHVLRIKAPGHDEVQVVEQLQLGEGVEVVYRLTALVSDPYETIIRDTRPRAEVSRVSLHAQELTEVPGTAGDPFRVIMLMPGVSTLASGLAYPVVRGSQPAATGYFIDGVQVPVLFHMGLGAAVVSPDFIDGLDFYPGTPPARYGRLLGGVVEANVTRPRDDKIRGSLSADLVNSSGLVEVPIPQTGTDVTLGGRFSYTGWLIAAASPVLGFGDEGKLVLDIWDYQARIEQKLPNDARLRLLALGMSDRAGFDTREPQGIDGYLRILFHRLDLRYRQKVLGGDLEAGVTWGQDRYGVEGFQDEKLVIDWGLRATRYKARATWTRAVWPGLELTAGGDLEHIRARNTIELGTGAATGADAPGSIVFNAPESIATLSGLYLQAIWEPAPSWIVTGGLRLDNYHLVPRLDRFAPEPRASVRFTVNEQLTLKGGAGLVHQSPTVLITLPVVDVAGLATGLQEAAQVDVGAEWKFWPGFELSADLYYSHLTRSYELDLFQTILNLRTRGLLARRLGTWGRGYGLELMLRHPIGQGWFGWISYSLQRTTRHVEYTRFDDAMQPIEETEGELPFAFDQTHVFNFALSYQFPGEVTAGVVLHFNTGRPESGQISSRTQVEWEDPDTGLPGWRPVSRDEIDRLPPFFRIDARVAKRWMFEDASLELFLDVLNAFGSVEVLGYDYRPLSDWSAREKVPFPQAPIFIPTLGMKGKF